ncbi:MAG: DNA-binding protein MutS2 [Methanosaeta sp. PtaU1.Bin112]|nr:MAG: DNA-binding protein MutS2 [Methanosaeta sp. PtaU1.Bin112]
MKLVDLPGVGSRIRERLIEQYGDEEKSLHAILNADVAGLCRTLSERQALLLVSHARGMKFAITPEQFLATDEATRIQQILLTRLASYAHTEYARLKIGTLFASSSGALLAENRKAALEAFQTAKMMQGRGLEKLLKDIRPLREKAAARVRERAVAATSAEDFQKLKSKGLDRLIDLHLAESPAELLDLARSYSHVCLIGDEVSGQAAEDMERAESLEEWYLVPEAVLGFYEENLETLLAAAQTAQKLHEAGIAGFAEWQSLHKLLARLNESADREGERLERLSASLGRCAEEAAAWANEQLKSKIEKSSLTLGGTDLLLVMSRGEGVREILEAQMKSVFAQVLKDAKARAAGQLDLAGAETVWLDEIFSEQISYPLELNRHALRSFELDLQSRREGRGLTRKREIARSLADKRDEAAALVHALMEFDYSYALGRFSLEERLTFPEIAEEPCLSFAEGRHLFLDRPEAVSYSLGSADHPEKVALLSGVNSGGKTTLLDLISQIVILAHMGLPVPAKDCRLSLFEEFYYFSKSRGTLSAGAFETAMRKFSVVENEKRKLVLADELEAITEPGASARIIACMLDELNRRGCVAVFVSHLAEDVRRCAETPVRVDGIEAEGLDENNNLRVSRSPRYNYLAKSTPELILDRLVRSTQGREREFYARLLAKFK